MNSRNAIDRPRTNEHVYLCSCQCSRRDLLRTHKLRNVSVDSVFSKGFINEIKKLRTTVLDTCMAYMYVDTKWSQTQFPPPEQHFNLILLP